MKALILGAAAGGGFPQWNCRCAVCAVYWSGDPRAKRRTQSSVAISRDGHSWTLLNASPDIGTQIASNRPLWPRELRDSPITSVVLTNADVDHIAGLLSLRERQAFDLFALPAVHEALVLNPIFQVISSSRPVKVVADEPFTTADGITIELFAVPGKAPLYLEGDDPRIGSEAGETAGVIVRDGERVLAYVPGCAHFSSALSARLAGADAILFDGTVFTDDEMIRAGVGEKTGRRMGHLPIAGPDGSLGVLAGLPAARKIYVHINNTNPILIEGSPEWSEVNRAGVEIAYDGMEIEL